MAKVRDDRRQMMLSEAGPSRRSAGVLVMMLVAVLAAIALIWNASRRSAHRPVAPVVSSEPTPEPAPEPAPEPPGPARAAAPVPAQDRPSTDARQAEISRVVRDGRTGLQACYQRALVRDATLVHGRLRVRVSVAPSGRVDSVKIDGPAAFRPLEPCLEEAISKWTFPSASEAYATQFPLVLQGNN